MTGTPVYTQRGARRVVKRENIKEAERRAEQREREKAERLEARLQEQRMRAEAAALEKARRAAERERERLRRIQDELARAQERSQLSWQAAELLVCEWMRANGYPDAQLTPPGSDGGVDVVARNAVAQVKHQGSQVGRPKIAELYGTAMSLHRQALFFSSSGFSTAALAWARANDVRCYTFPPVREVRA